MTLKDSYLPLECTQETVGKLICWCCMKQYGVNEGGDAYRLGQCCDGNSYPQLESSYPQLVEEPLL